MKKDTLSTLAQAGDDSAAEPRIITVDISRYREDAENSRTKMDPVKLGELKESIRLWGVRQLLEVREIPGDELGPLYEVVAGNRRLRATRILCEELAAPEMAWLLESRRKLRAMVLSPTDAEDRKCLQLIENLQREDLSPLDEARSLVWLVEHHGETAASLADKLGMSRQHVHNRLRLPLAPAGLLAALEAGAVTAKHCEQVARLPDADDREELAERVLKPKFQTEPLSLADTIALIRRDYMVALNPKGGPGFDPEDGDLVPAAGVCSACPHLAANCDDVPKADGKGGRGVPPMTCLSPACFRRKRQAALDRLAEQRGVPSLDATTCEAVWSGHEGEVAMDSAYVPLETLPTPVAKGWDGPVFVGRHPTSGAVVDLVPRPLAEEAQRLRNESPDRKHGKGGAKDRKKGNEKAQRREAVRAMEALYQRIAARGVTAADVLALVGTELEESPDALSMFRLWLKPQGDDLKAVMDAMESHPLGELVAPGTPKIQLNLAYLVCAVLGYNLYWRGAKDPAFVAFAERYGVELGDEE